MKCLLWKVYETGPKDGHIVDCTNYREAMDKFASEYEENNDVLLSGEVYLYPGHGEIVERARVSWIMKVDPIGKEILGDRVMAEVAKMMEE